MKKNLYCLCALIVTIFIFTGCKVKEYDFKVDGNVVEGLVNITEEELHEGIYLPMLNVSEVIPNSKSENEYVSLDGSTGIVFEVNPQKDPERMSEAEKRNMSQKITDEVSQLEMTITFYNTTTDYVTAHEPLMNIKYNTGMPYRKLKNLRISGNLNENLPTKEWYLFYIQLNEATTLETANESDLKIKFIQYN